MDKKIIKIVLTVRDEQIVYVNPGFTWLSCHELDGDIALYGIGTGFSLAPALINYGDYQAIQIRMFGTNDLIPDEQENYFLGTAILRLTDKNFPVHVFYAE